jgi:hypothetical protein
MSRGPIDQVNQRSTCPEKRLAIGGQASGSMYSQ